MIISFLYPSRLLLLLLIPLLFLIHFYSLNNRKKVALDFANFDAISRIQGIDFFSKNIISLILTILIISLLVFSASGLTLHTSRESSSFSFVIAIDSSQSMEAKDILPSRLESAKDKSIEFIDQVTLSEKVGVVSFSGSTKIESPLTDNTGEIKSSIRDISLSNLGGTDFYELIITSSNLLEGEDAKAIVILSDGQNNVGELDDAVKYANTHNVIVHTIGIGTEEGGMTSYALSKLDEDSLKGISYNTGGKYFRVTNSEELSDSFLDILSVTTKKVSIDLSKYLLLLSLILIIFDFFLRNTRYSSIF